MELTKYKIIALETEQDYHRALEVLRSVSDKLLEKDKKLCAKYKIVEQLVEAYRYKFIPIREAHDRLKYMIESKQILQKQLAAHLKTSQSSVSSMINGSRRITKAMADRFGEVLQCDPLLFYTPRRGK
jgi:antitoxin component HigA of HigAB toxin-antitoxin module